MAKVLSLLLSGSILALGCSDSSSSGPSNDGGGSRSDSGIDVNRGDSTAPDGSPDATDGSPADGSAVDSSTADGSGKPAVVLTVDLDPAHSSAQQMPTALRPGMYWGKRDPEQKARLLSLSQNSARLGWYMDFYLYRSRVAEVPDLKAFTRKLNTEQIYLDTAASAAEVIAAGGLPIVLIFGVPEYLSSCPGPSYSRSCPPSSAAGYRDMVQAVVTFFSVTAGLGSNVAYEIWNEPDLESWQGTHRQYFQLYAAGAWGALRAHAAAGLDPPMVGGPSISHPLATIETSPGVAAYYMREFFDFVAATPIVDTAHGINRSHLPLGFVSYHQYTRRAAHRAGGHASQLRKWLSASGLDPQTPIAITEWGQWWDHHADLAFADPFYEQLDSEVNGAYAVAGIVHMATNGVDYHNLSTLTDFVLPENGPNGGFRPQFHGSEAIFTLLDIAKPTFNALRLLDAVASMPLRAETAPDHLLHSVTSLAGTSADGSQAAVLLANAVPDRAILYADVLTKWLRRERDADPAGYAVAVAQLGDPNVKGQLMALLNQELSIDVVLDSDGQPLEAVARRVVLSALEEMWAVEPLQTESIEVTLVLTNAPAHVQRRYRVDQRHANSHAAYMEHWRANGFDYADFGGLHIVTGHPHYDIEAGAVSVAKACSALVENGVVGVDDDGSIRTSLLLPPHSVVLLTFSEAPLLDTPSSNACSL